MSIANALNNAASGLAAVARGTEVVSTNLANALTPGYSRRALELSPRIMSGNGGGVHVDGISRAVSSAVLSEYRIASADLARAMVSSEFYGSLEKTIGLPHEAGSLSDVMISLETALASAASRPDSDLRLGKAVEAADKLAGKFRSISDTIQRKRADADRMIGTQVDQLQKGLNEVAKLNRQIIVENANGRDASSLEDARQGVINQISEIVPLREVKRPNGRLALFSKEGAVLLDGKTPAKLEFQPSGRFTADMVESAQGAGRLFIDGEPVADAGTSLLAGGSLTELFKLRDEDAVAAQRSVDELAYEVYARFADKSVDASIARGDPGLFTDAGTAVDPAKITGLSSRIRVNSAVLPSSGGNLERLRDGIYASVPGDVGDATVLSALSKAMSTIRPSISAAAAETHGSLHGLSAALVSDISSSRLSSETRQTHDAAIRDTLYDSLQSAAGVDSDREMEILLQLEKAYAANAKVIQTVNEMLETILRI
ncbi:flagellar hook-associated protein FlgK [Paracoccus sp. SCSIO 75233]|uniref:flagellar hook-associated protein FlgK n=1 Tax=Paracoccus sp. SCSIO 75233 TaxID=3017782 RepID=UPI0022F03691|nr:flagellar hook-associated protein FlgK [Paracoccus sp. SCSIO 75233]WBU52947.1 flagellar hook-associated protein FlgK [Paracoccus sp. SCSIO 75233]